VEQDKTQGKKIEIKVKAGASSHQQQNRTARFDKPEHPVSPGPVQKQNLRTTAPGTVPAPPWCLPGLMPSQRRRIQRMRVQKLREEAVEKETDEHFNTIWHMIPMKQEWRVKEKEKTSVPTLTASNDDMDLLDDDESPLIKNGSLPPACMDVNMVFTLSTGF
jgi:hypothetical protein